MRWSVKDKVQGLMTGHATTYLQIVARRLTRRSWAFLGNTNSRVPHIPRHVYVTACTQKDTLYYGTHCMRAVQRDLGAHFMFLLEAAALARPVIWSNTGVTRSDRPLLYHRYNIGYLMFV